MFLGFYNDEDLLEYFGKLEPSTEERTKVFNELWRKYGKANEIDLASVTERRITAKDISDIRKRFGTFNVVSRGTRLRFKDKDDMLVLRLMFK